MGWHALTGLSARPPNPLADGQGWYEVRAVGAETDNFEFDLESDPIPTLDSIDSGLPDLLRLRKVAHGSTLLASRTRRLVLPGG